MVTRHYHKPTTKLFIFQLSLIALMTGIAWLFIGPFNALSLSAGGFVSLIPSWLFSQLLFRYRGALKAREIVFSLFLGEVVKILVAVGLFIIVFNLLKLAPLPFFIGLMIVQFSLWFAPWLVK